MHFILLIKLILIVALIIAGLRLKISLGLVFTIGSILTAVLFGVPLGTTALTFFNTLTDSLTLQIVGTIILIMILESIMSEQGTMDVLVEGVNKSIKSPLAALAILPILVGILPSPGGAMFSCPLVDQVSKKMDLTAEVKGFINYWFRHLWEYSCPLYPAIILAAGITDIPLSNLILYMIPISIAQVAVGGLALWRIGGKQISENEVKEKSSLSGWLMIFKGISPILFIIALVAIFRLAPVISVLLVVAAMLIKKRYTLKDVLRITKSMNKQMVISVIGAMLFKDMLIAGGVPEVLPEIMIKLGLSDTIIIAILPFLMGVLVGLTPGMVGLSFPLVIGFVGGIMEPSSVFLAFVCGFAGMMITPLHLCFIISVDYFKAKFNIILRWVIYCEAVMVAFGFLLYFYIY